MTALTTTAVTMTSREIADLVEQRHDNVKRTIETIASRGVITLPQTEEVSNAGPGPKTIAVYRIGKRDSFVIVAQLSPEFTARLVDRWQELESRVPAPMVIPATLPDALRLAADLAEQKAHAEAQLADALPKALALDRITASEEALTFTQAAKALGIKRLALTNWLHASGWIYRQNGSWVAHDQHIRNGRLQFKEARYTDDDTGQERHRPYCHILPKGLAIVARHFDQREEGPRS